MDKAHMDNGPRRRARSTGPSRSAGPGVRVGRSAARVPRSRATAAEAVVPEASGVATDATAPVPGRRTRAARSRPAATRPTSARSTSPSRRSGRISAVTRSRQPSVPMARSRLALNLVVLGLVFVAVAFILAVPLRNYFAQRNQLEAAVATERSMTAEKEVLQQQKAALSDPAYVLAEAKRRLQLVQPGDTVYVVHAPALPTPAAPGPAAPVVRTPWYSDLWNTLSDPVGGAAAVPKAPGRAGG